MSIIDSLHIIAKNFGIEKIIQVTKGDKYCQANGEDVYINRSYIAGCDEIYLGIYDDEELLILSFFHELGHTKTENTTSKFIIEKEAWSHGFEIAKEYGYSFSDKAHEWAEEQLKTYENNENYIKI